MAAGIPQVDPGNRLGSLGDQSGGGRTRAAQSEDVQFVAAIAKRDLAAGELLDGEGGYTVTGGLRPGKASIAAGYLPLGLAHNVKLRNSIADGTPITFQDLEIDETTTAFKLRKWMEGIV